MYHRLETDLSHTISIECYNPDHRLLSIFVVCYKILHIQGVIKSCVIKSRQHFCSKFVTCNSEVIINQEINAFVMQIINCSKVCINS